MVTTDVAALAGALNVDVSWRVTFHSQVADEDSWVFDLTGEAWDAYEALINSLEHDGFARDGVEMVKYGQGAMQMLRRDHTVVTVNIARTARV